MMIRRARISKTTTMDGADLPGRVRRSGTSQLARREHTAEVDMGNLADRADQDLGSRAAQAGLDMDNPAGRAGRATDSQRHPAVEASDRTAGELIPTRVARSMRGFGMLVDIAGIGSRRL